MRKAPCNIRPLACLSGFGPWRNKGGSRSLPDTWLYKFCWTGLRALLTLHCPAFSAPIYLCTHAANSSLKRWKIGSTRVHRSIEILKASQANVGSSLVRARGLGLILRGFWLHSLGCWLCPLSHLFFFNANSAFYFFFPSLLPASRILVVEKHFLILTVSVPLVQVGNTSTNISLKKCVGLLWVFLRFNLLGKSHT